MFVKAAFVVLAVCLASSYALNLELEAEAEQHKRQLGNLLGAGDLGNVLRGVLTIARLDNIFLQQVDVLIANTVKDLCRAVRTVLPGNIFVDTFIRKYGFLDARVTKRQLFGLNALALDVQDLVNDIDLDLDIDDIDADVTQFIPGLSAMCSALRDYRDVDISVEDK